MIKQTADHADCADRAGCATLMFAFFFTVIYILLRCVHLFLTLLVTLELFPTFGHHITKFYEVLMRSSHLEKQNRGVKFLELVQISTTRHDVTTRIFTKQPKELYSREIF